MECPPSGAERINSFALVCYLPGALGAFLDGLRAELVTSCQARSHVTILPPRQLGVSEFGGEAGGGLQGQPVNEDRVAMLAKRRIADSVPNYLPFRVELGEVEVFPQTKVIYLGLHSGGAQMQLMHDALNADVLRFREPFLYHPHVTLAQGLDPDMVDQAADLAEARWREFERSRSFQVETLTFVQNTAADRWLDLAEYELGALAAVRR